ncbi:MAG: tetratricopeptide repeat protein [bacterium]
MPKLQAKVLFDRGLIQFHKKKPDQAAELFKEAVFEDPNYPEALYNLSCCYAMLGERDDCIVYLDRAMKLDPQCSEWAKEDPEFDSMRKDEGFIRVLGSDPFKATEPDNSDMLAMIDTGDDDEEGEGFESMDPGQLEHLDEPSSGQTSRGTMKTDELPPCAQCGALVEEMRIQRFNSLVSLVVTMIGVGLSIALTFLQFIYSVTVGIPLVAMGLWMFTRVERTWVCQNCGARGRAAGQPVPGQEDESSLGNQPARTEVN